MHIDKTEKDEKERNDAAMEKWAEELRKKDLADSERLMIDKTRIEEMGVKQDEEAQLRKLKNAQALKNTGAFRESGAEQIRDAAAAYAIEEAPSLRIIELEQIKQNKLRESGYLETDPRIQASLRTQEAEFGRLGLAVEKYDHTIAKVASDQEKAFQASFHKIGTYFNSAFGEWLKGGETFGQAMAKMWQKQTAVQSLLKIGEQMALAVIEAQINVGSGATAKRQNAASTAGHRGFGAAATRERDSGWRTGCDRFRGCVLRTRRHHASGAQIHFHHDPPRGNGFTCEHFQKYSGGHPFNSEFQYHDARRKPGNRWGRHHKQNDAQSHQRERVAHGIGRD